MGVTAIPIDSNGNYSLPPGYLAVSGQTILASQHNPPLEDIAAALSQMMLRSGAAPMSGPLNMNGYVINNLGSNSSPTAPATNSQITDLDARITALLPTGAVQAFRRTSAPAGWIKENGGTIGSATSGATTRANADTQALFTLLWSQFNNTRLPIQTSSGAAGTRGASAAADFAANKRMPLFDSRTRFLRGSDESLGFDASLIVGLSQADAVKAHTHTVPPHSHPIPSRTRSEYGFNSGGSRIASVNGSNLPDSTLDAYDTSNSSAFQTASTGDALETRGRSSVVLYCIKL